jgi:YXWGXW repeat-containing protein
MRRFGSTIAISLLLALAMPVVAMAQELIIRIAPPELPVYEQPPLPAYGYIWAPGYWAYGPDGYYWVPGTWVEPPSVGVLWTPGYWGWHDGVYGWNAGYWGPHIGFYGGVNYGFGYGGVGYEGGRWNNGVFAYNQTVNNFGGVRVTNVYSQTVVNNTTTRVSFNGGTGGTAAQPTPQEQAAAKEQHVAATPMQTQHEQTASTNKSLLASVNHGNPAIAATSKPGEFSGKGVVPAKAVQPGAAAPGMATTPKAAPAANTARTAPGAGAAEKRGPVVGARTTPNGNGVPPRPVNTQAKPLAAVSPTRSAPPRAAPKPPPPHPVAAARPPARPAGPPPKKKPG